MRLTILCATLALTFVAPLAANAADSDDAMTAATSNYGVVVCRVARPNEKINARMVNRPTSLVCKPIDPAGSMATIANVKAKSPERLGPNLSGTLSPLQVDRAWRRYLDKTFMIDHSS